MIRVQRGAMIPGQVFVFVARGPWIGREPEAFVVLDKDREVGFWTGRSTCLGDVAPSMEFELIAGMVVS